MRTNVQVLRISLFSSKDSREDDLRLDIVLTLLTRKKREYFLNRYYYFCDKVKEKSGLKELFLSCLMVKVWQCLGSDILKFLIKRQQIIIHHVMKHGRKML